MLRLLAHLRQQRDILFGGAHGRLCVAIAHCSSCAQIDEFSGERDASRADVASSGPCVALWFSSDATTGGDGFVINYSPVLAPVWRGAKGEGRRHRHPFTCGHQATPRR